jgi:methionine synthase I (cobalamin-dependent)
MEWEDFSEFQDMNLKEQRDMVYNELLVASDRGYVDRKHLKQYEQITDALNETIENVIEKLHRDFGQIAQHTLIRTATFSNGNSIYSEVQP